MISVNRRTLYGEVFNDVRCLSSDEKPTEGIKNGSTLIEIDTGKRYLYDALSCQWNEFSQGGGGGDYVLPTMSPTTKGGATVGEGLTMDGTALSVDYSEVASVDALEEATALSPTGGIVSTQDGLAIDTDVIATREYVDSRINARGTVYGFHVDSNESDSTACVTYLADALGMTPAHMDYANQRFDYGSWENAFFMPKPCMLKYDGTVDYYLDPNDYAKKLDSTASDVADPTYAGNAMMEWGRDGKIIWYKVVLDADPTSYSVYIADNQVDDAYVCYPFINGDGDIVKHFYTPCYFGSIVNDGTKDVLRSLSGQLGSARCKSKTAAQERTMAKANNPDGIDIWDTEVYADVILVNFLLTLISKSIESRTAFGQGIHTSGTDAINDGFTSGVHDTKGLFWGTNSGAAETYMNAVKVFGMENWWGFMWRRFAGLVAVNGTEKYKLTRGTQDGSTANDYVVSTTGSAYDGYLMGGTLPAASGSYIKKQELRPDGSYTPTVVGGSASTYYRDALWTNLNAVTFAFRGGASADSARVGAWYLALDNEASRAAWVFGAAPSCKPQSPEAAMASRIKKLEQTVAQLVAGE